MKIVKFSCHGCHAPAYGCSLPGDNSGSYVLHSDFAALLARHNALVEVVTWERECERVEREARGAARPGHGVMAWATGNLTTARAEVDRLLGES